MRCSGVRRSGPLPLGPGLVRSSRKHSGSSALKPVQGERWPGAVTQQPPAHGLLHLGDRVGIDAGGSMEDCGARRRGLEHAVDDHAVKGRGQFAVSFGTFRTEAAAVARADELAALGIKRSKVQPRTATITQTLLIVRDSQQPVVARLKDLQAQYPGTEVKIGTCERTT